MDYTLTTLKSGLRLIFIPMPQLQSATLSFYIANGSRYESGEISGMSHFLEHMLFKGSANFPTAKDIFGSVEALGGVLNGWTGLEATSYWTKVPAAHVLKALEVLTDLTFRPLIDGQELAKERQVVLEEVARKNDHPEDLAADNLGELLWPEQAVGRPTLGSPESLKNIDREKMRRFYRAQYAAGNIIFGAAGNIDQGEIREYLGGNIPLELPREPELKAAAADGQQTGPRLKLAAKKTDQTHLCLGFKAYAATHPRRFALMLLSAVLGEGASSRLFQTIREKLGLAYAVGSEVDFLTDTGEAVVQAGLNSDKLELALSALLTELGRLKNEPAAGSELELAREMLKGHLQLGLEDSHQVLDFFVRQLLLSGKILTPEAYLRGLDGVTLYDLQSTAREIFRVDNLSLSLVSPRADPAPLEKIIGSFK